mmetsp:Transcript_9793/g.18414  ORF Transcript_9793/g.18414 Transcript_9793/m.18414 type:complete len:378 (-) Transcript_9793:101-1234(-)
MTDGEFSKKQIRRIAIKCPQCTEILKNNKNSNILSFLISIQPNPARVQIYCDTRTVITLRVFDGTVRHIIKPNCSLKDVEHILKDPPELSLLNLDKLPYDNGSSTTKKKEEDEKEEQPIIMTDEYMLDIGETILAAESEALKAHYHALKIQMERSHEPEVEFACSFPSHVMDQVEKIIHDGPSSTSSIRKKQRMICAATDGQSAVFIYESGLWRATKELSKGLMTQLLRHSSPPTYVSLGSKGRYYASFQDGKKVWEGPQSMDLFFLKKPVRCIAFGRTVDDFMVVYEDGTWKYSGSIPRDLVNILNSKNGAAILVRCITMGANGEYFLKDVQGNMWWGGLSNVVNGVLDEVIDDGNEIDFMDFGSLNDSYFLIYKC